MKYFILLLLIHTYLDAKDVQIGGRTYTIVEESYNEYNDKGIAMKLYKKTDNKDALPLFSFTVENQLGGCGERSMQEGSYEINGTMLTFYTHWARSGRAYDAPSGDRIQHYVMDNNGTMHFKEGILYIEQQAKNYDKESGQKYLYVKPTTQREKEKLQEYIQNIEHTFGGRFVFDDAAVKLHKKVENALMKKRQTRWQ